jgi:DNA helicase-2/ATP-dependent DNA helicase PcrA
MNFTPEQRAIIHHAANAVVIARPGSGKTATVAQIVKNRLALLPEHRGVIAISYTNKASDELRNRALSGGIDKKSSFFGTIDRFFITEIVIPFGRHLWGRPGADLAICKNAEIPEELRLSASDLEVDEPDFERMLPRLGELYLNGFIVLESVGFLACHLFANSVACKRYLLARYTELIIDEYQDCGHWQHAFLLLATGAGLRSIAVGDLDQSIFLFAGKKAQYLRELQREPGFGVFFLTLNHRCHPSIAEYAARFISAQHPVPADLELRVFEKRVTGSERDIGTWLNAAIPAVAELFTVRARNQIGILVKSKRTANLVAESLTLPYKYSVGTVLDEDASPAASVYREVLQWIFDPRRTRRGFIDAHLPPDSRAPVIRRAIELLTDLQLAAQDAQLSRHVESFRELAQVINARPAPDRVTDRLSSVLGSEELLQSFVAPYSDQVQLMTIHKAKGLEFEVVFHLDLYEFIFPQYNASELEEEQDQNLHYVALTRAKQACILCTSSKRHNNTGCRSASASPYLYRNNVEALRLPAPF